MEGLLIAEQLARLAPLLPSRRGAWRFPDADTAVLPLEQGALWLYYRPPEPRLEFRDEAAGSGPHSNFQELLVARAAGDLLAARQPQLDRVASFDFAGADGFVSTEPVTLVAELTGRNCNLILLDGDGVIVGAAREVGSDRNRFRQVRRGLRYQPPPPYQKLDPRTASDDELRAALQGKRLRDLRRLIDGIGPLLTRALAARLELDPDTALSGGELERVIAALHELVRSPSAFVEAAAGLPDVETLRRRERRGALEQEVRAALGKRLALLDKRLADIERARVAAAKAGALRAEADLLMARAREVPAKAECVTLEGFDGQPQELQLDPRFDAIGNAQQRYRQAKKREARLAHAAAREEELVRERAELAALRARLGELPEEELERLSERWRPKVQGGKKRIGLRFVGPHGFQVVVGRNARENDLVTFQVARSRDLWLHVQGYHGSHVVVLAENREVPFDTVLFAAELAAAFSQASASDNVPVDYTLRKNVWKVKGMPPGAVHYAHQKTVYVTPDRHAEAVLD